MYNEYHRLLPKQARPLQIRQLSFAVEPTVVHVNAGHQSNQYVAAGTFYPIDGIQLPYAVAGICEPFTQGESRLGMISHDQPGFLRRQCQRLANTLIFNHPRREYHWYQHRRLFLFILLSITLATWSLVFLLNPFSGLIRESADEFADNFANLGQDPQEGVENSVDEILTVIVYVAVTQSIVTLSVLFGWIVDMLTRPITPFIAAFEKGAYAADAPEHVPKGTYTVTSIVDQDGKSVDLVKAKGRWWMLQTKTFVVRDSHYELLPGVAFARQGQQLLERIMPPRRRGHALNAELDPMGAYSNLHASVKKTLNATDLRSLLEAASGLAKSLKTLHDSIGQQGDATLTRRDQSLLRLLAQPVAANNNNNNNDDDDNDNDNEMDEAQYLAHIAKQQAVANSTADGIIGLTQQIDLCLQEFNAESRAVSSMAPAQPVPDPAQPAAVPGHPRQRFFGGVDLMGTRQRYQELKRRLQSSDGVEPENDGAELNI